MLNSSELYNLKTKKVINEDEIFHGRDGNASTIY